MEKCSFLGVATSVHPSGACTVPAMVAVAVREGRYEYGKASSRHSSRSSDSSAPISRRFSASATGESWRKKIETDWLPRNIKSLGAKLFYIIILYHDIANVVIPAAHSPAECGVHLASPKAQGSCGR